MPNLLRRTDNKSGCHSVWTCIPQTMVSPHTPLHTTLFCSLLNALDRQPLCPMDRKEVVEEEIIMPQFSVPGKHLKCSNFDQTVERDNTEVEKFFTGMTDDEKRDNKNLRCKMAKEIFKREALSKKVTMLELEKQDHDKQMSDA